MARAIVTECARRTFSHPETLAILTLAIDENWADTSGLTVLCDRYEQVRAGTDASIDAWWMLHDARHGSISPAARRTFKQRLYTHIHTAAALYDAAIKEEQVVIPRRNLDFLWSIVIPRDNKPYGYGGRWARDDVNVTTDCSGIVSNVLEALVRGPEGFDWDREPYSTESWRVVPVGGKGPFGTICVAKPDDIPADAAVAIGCSHGGGGPNSHMACTVFHPELGHVNIESSGSNGQQVGPPARGYRDPSFHDWHYLPGPFESAEDWAPVLNELMGIA